MFDKYGFYYAEKIGKQKYNLDIGGTNNIILDNNEYIIFHKRRFKKTPTNKLQKGFGIITKSKNIDFNFSKDYFKYGLCYYQKKNKKAIIKGGGIGELESYNKIFNIFDLKLKFIDYLEIIGNYIGLEEINNKFKKSNLSENISFLFALTIVYGKWNIVEENDDIYLGNIIIKCPFDNNLNEFKSIIFNIEDSLINNGIFNKLYYTKKQEFLFNIIDYDLLKLFGELTINNYFKYYFQSSEVIKPIFDLHNKNLSKQLNSDLRLNLNNFKISEIEGISLNY